MRVDLEDFNHLYETHYLKKQRHPTLPITIWNYSERCSYERYWNETTMMCRGLVTDDDGVVWARCMPKFFNATEPGVVIPDEPFTVTVKLDGCLPRLAPLNLWGGGYIPISEVVRNKLTVELVGVDQSGKLVPALVTGWHDNGKKTEWVDIRVSGHSVVRGTRYNNEASVSSKLRLTLNHSVAVLIDGKHVYKPASEVAVGDVLISYENRVVLYRAVIETARVPYLNTTGFDVTTTTGNYMYRDLLVHNSLSQIFNYKGDTIVSSRGSFVSDQARWAREMIGDFKAPEGITLCLELVKNENRIVVRYDYEGLILLAAFETDSGKEIPYEELHKYWPNVVERQECEDFRTLPQNPNEEGYVIRFAAGLRVKIKNADYIRLHRLVTNTSPKDIWEMLRDGKTIDELIEAIPDEFFQFVTETSDRIRSDFNVIADQVHERWNVILNEGWSNGEMSPALPQHRKWFALRIQQEPTVLQSPLFAILSEKDPTPIIWKQVRPVAETPFANDADA